MTRLFIAVDLPSGCRKQLADLRIDIKGARWIDEENIHLTLAFLGEVGDHLRLDLDEALGEVRASAFAVDLSGVGWFPTRGEPTVFWVGCQPNEALDRLKRRVDRALAEVGIRLEKRRFRPHITVARLKHCRSRDLGQIERAHSLFRLSEVPVSSFSLMSSRLDPEGAVYHRLQRVELGGESTRH